MKLLLISMVDNITAEFSIRYIGGFLEKHGHQVTLLFIPKWVEYFETPKELGLVTGLIRANGINLVGISLMTVHFQRAINLTQKIKSGFSDLPVIWGGIHPTANPDECIQHADSVCIGEGELALRELCDKMDNGKPYYNTPGFWFKENSNVIKNGLYELETNLDKFPYPAIEPSNSFILHSEKIKPFSGDLVLEILPQDGQWYKVLTTRGCPFACAYCSNSLFRKMYHGKHLRRRCVESVIKELIEVKEKLSYIRGINISDDSFILGKDEWLEQFCNEYTEKIKLPFYCRVIPSYLNRKRLSLLKSAGMEGISMGLQSGSPWVNKEIYKRNVSNKAFLEASELADSFGLFKRFDVILDNPYEKEDNIIETIKVLQQVKKPYYLHTFSLRLYPGTELYYRAAQDNLLDHNNPYEKGFSDIESTYLNEIVKIIPLTPNLLIDFFIKYKDWNLMQKIVQVYYRFYTQLLQKMKRYKSSLFLMRTWFVSRRA